MFALNMNVFLNNYSMKTFSQQRSQRTELSFQPVSMFKVTSLSFLSLWMLTLHFTKTSRPQCRGAAVQLANKLFVFGSDCTVIKWPLTLNNVGATRKCCANLEILSVLHTPVAVTLSLPLLVWTAGCPRAKTITTMS